MSIISTSRGELPASVRALESQLGQEIARQPHRVHDLLDGVSQTLQAMQRDERIGDIRYGDDLVKVGKRVRFRGTSVAARTLSMSHALRRTLQTKDLTKWGAGRNWESGAWQWPTTDAEWRAGDWHKWSFANRQTLEPVTGFVRGMLEMLDDMTEGYDTGDVALVVDAAHEASRAYQPVLGRKYHPDFIRDASQPTVISIALTLTTVRYLQQVGKLPAHALDARGATLGRLTTTIASMSPQGSGWFHGTHGLSSFHRPDKTKLPEIRCYPTPNPGSDLEWRADRVFVFEPERPGGTPRLHIAQAERPDRDDRHCPGVAVSVNLTGDDVSPDAPLAARLNPLAAVSLMTSLYEVGDTRVLERTPDRCPMSAPQLG